MASPAPRNGPACGFRTLLAQVGVKDGAAWVLAEGADGAMLSRSVPIDKMLDDAFVAYAQNGEAIRPENGYPMRLILPGWEGNINVKWLRRLKIGDKPFMTREETGEIYRSHHPDRQGAAIHLGDGSQIRSSPSLRATCGCRARAFTKSPASPGRAARRSSGWKSPPMAARAGAWRRCRSRCCPRRMCVSAIPGIGTETKRSSKAAPPTRPAMSSPPNRS